MPLSERDRARIAMKPRNTKRQLTVGASAVAIGNLISDLLYAVLDPRVRL